MLSYFSITILFLCQQTVQKKVIYTPKHITLILEYKRSKTTSEENKPLNMRVNGKWDKMTTNVILLEWLDVFDKRANFMDKEKAG